MYRNISPMLCDNFCYNSVGSDITKLGKNDVEESDNGYVVINDVDGAYSRYYIDGEGECPSSKKIAALSCS